MLWGPGEDGGRGCHDSIHVMLLGKMDSVCAAATGLVYDAGQRDSNCVFHILPVYNASCLLVKTEERNQQPDSKQLKCLKT